VLVVASVAGLPMLFGNQPRPIPVDIPIEIPDRNQPPALPHAKPQPAVSLGGSLSHGEESVASGTPAPAVPATAPAAVAAAVVAPAVAVSAKVVEPKDAALVKPAEPAAAHPRESDKAAKPSAKPVGKATPDESKPKSAVVEAKPPKPAAPSDADRAQALLEGKSVPTPEPAAADAGARWIVQVGAFADPVKAREARAKLEGAGLKTYTHVAQTADGPRTRVRMGPFKLRAEADKAAARAKQLSLGAAVLSL
jgi:DedD protein